MQELRSQTHVLDADTLMAPAVADDCENLARWLTQHHHRAARLRHSKGTQVFGEGDETSHLFVLVEGWALKYKWLYDGRRQVLDFVLPGDVLGVLNGDRAPHSVEMLTDGEVVSIPRDAFDALAAVSPELPLAVARQMERISSRANDHVVSISCRSAMARVTRLLLELAERLAPTDAAQSPRSFLAPIRQQHIADALGLRIETVCRSLKRLERSGVASFRQGRLRIFDSTALQHLAESDSDEPELGDAAARQRAPAPTGLALVPA